MCIYIYKAFGQIATLKAEIECTSMMRTALSYLSAVEKHVPCCRPAMASVGPLPAQWVVLAAVRAENLSSSHAFKHESHSPTSVHQTRTQTHTRIVIQKQLC